MKNLDITCGVWHKESGGYNGIRSGSLAEDRISHKNQQGKGNPAEVSGLLRQPAGRGQRVPRLELPDLALSDGGQATTPARVGAFPETPKNGTFENLRVILVAAARPILVACLVASLLCPGCGQSTKRMPIQPPPRHEGPYRGSN